MSDRLILAAFAVVNSAHRIATYTAGVAAAESRPSDYRGASSAGVVRGDLRIAQSGHRAAVLRWAKLGESSTAADYLTAQGFELRSSTALTLCFERRHSENTQKKKTP